jgi:energy-coupling factor transporter ATP-binding protein EcfA2
VRNETWLEELACELRARGVGPTDVAGVVVELQGHLHDSAQSALDSFGAPQAYAAQVSSAIGAGERRPARGPVRIEAHRVAKSYKQRSVLRHVDLEVRAGDVTALIGPNGCGKSTFLRVLAGFERPDEPRLGLAGWPRRVLVGGRLAGLLAIGGIISAGFFLLVAVDRDVYSLGTVAVDFAVTMLVAVAFGTALGSVVRRELEGALVIFFVAGLQATVNPYAAASKLLPFWSSREIATVSVDGPATASVSAGLLHALLVIALCAAVILTSLDARSQRPAPQQAT